MSAWLNPTPEQEQAWQALSDVLRLRDLDGRRRFLADYREKWGQYAAESLALSVRAEWDKRRSQNV
jgi:hypothetical protein